MLEVLEVPEIPEVMRCALLCLEAVESGLRLLEVMRSVLLCIRETVEGGLCLPDAFEVPEEPKAMRPCYSVCRRLWRVGSVYWRRCAVCDTVSWRLWRVGSICRRCWR